MLRKETVKHIDNLIVHGFSINLSMNNNGGYLITVISENKSIRYTQSQFLQKYVS